MVAGAGRWSHCVTVREQRELDAGTQLTLPLFSLGLSTRNGTTQIQGGPSDLSPPFQEALSQTHLRLFS